MRVTYWKKATYFDVAGNEIEGQNKNTRITRGFTGAQTMRKGEVGQEKSLKLGYTDATSVAAKGCTQKGRVPGSDRQCQPCLHVIVSQVNAHARARSHRHLLFRRLVRLVIQPGKTQERALLL